MMSMDSNFSRATITTSKVVVFLSLLLPLCFGLLLITMHKLLLNFFVALLLWAVVDNNA